jgi:RimJ/RimL family protein N-acetyltransferase
MVSAPDRFIFAQIPIRDAATAFQFHLSLALEDQYIWPRSEEQIRSFAENGELFGIRKRSTGELVGLCYMTLEESTQEFELGGLMISDSAKRLGLGSFLVNFALGQLIAYAQPWANGQEIIAHVHELNEKPRNILLRAGFQHIGKVEAPPSAPASMKRNEQGKVIGDKFLFPTIAVGQLSSWFDTCDWILRDHESRAELEIPLDEIKATLRKIAAETNR